MNTRKLSYVFFSLGLVLLLSGGFSSFFIGLKNDHQEVLRRMDSVSLTFEGFSTNVTAFEEARDELYNDVLGNVYYETMFSTDQEVKQKIADYEKLVTEIDQQVKDLDSLCGKVYYPDAGANQQCENYKSIYEQVINYFISDLHTYNDNVQKYNEYQKAIHGNQLVDEYKIKWKYIDYNQDGIFDGKE